MERGKRRRNTDVKDRKGQYIRIRVNVRMLRIEKRRRKGDKEKK